MSRGSSIGPHGESDRSDTEGYRTVHHSITVSDIMSVDTDKWTLPASATLQEALLKAKQSPSKAVWVMLEDKLVTVLQKKELNDLLKGGAGCASDPIEQWLPSLESSDKHSSDLFIMPDTPARLSAALMLRRMVLSGTGDSRSKAKEGLADAGSAGSLSFGTGDSSSEVNEGQADASSTGSLSCPIPVQEAGPALSFAVMLGTGGPAEEASKEEAKEVVVQNEVKEEQAARADSSLLSIDLADPLGSIESLGDIGDIMERDHWLWTAPVPGARLRPLSPKLSLETAG
eukprot:gene10036-7927_t